MAVSACLSSRASLSFQTIFMVVLLNNYSYNEHAFNDYLSYNTKFDNINHFSKKLVRAKGIEPSSSAWEADVLPLYYARKSKMILYRDRKNIKDKNNKYLTFYKFYYIIRLQIPKIAIIDWPVRGNAWYTIR